MVKELNDINFEKEVKASDKIVIVDFWAPWCAPCRMQAPIVEELESEMGDKVMFAKVNVDENLQTAEKLNVSAIPSLVIYKLGEVVETLVGLTTKAELKETLLKHI